MESKKSFKNSRRKRRPGKVIHIDLTDDEPKEKIEYREKKKYRGGSLRWLKKIIEQDKVRKNGRGKNNKNNNSDVQIADAHSTANSRDINDKMPNYKPVFVNEVSESNPTNLMCQDINYSTLSEVTANCSKNNNSCSNNNNSKTDNLLLFYNDKLRCDLAAKQSCSSGDKSSKDVQELIINNRNKKIKNDDDDDDDSDYDNDISNLEMCPVTTTVSSEDLSGDGIFWDDVNLFKYNDYKLEFDMDNNYSDLKPTSEINLKETGTDVGIFDNILQDVPIDSRPGNWSYLFDCHLANIESPDAILASTELIDPTLTRKSFSKHNYMVSLGLSKKDCDDKAPGDEQPLECQFVSDPDKKTFDDFGRQSSSGVSSTTSIISEQCQPRVDGKSNASNRQSKMRGLKGIKEPALKKKKKSNIFQHRRLHFKEGIRLINIIIFFN